MSLSEALIRRLKVDNNLDAPDVQALEQLPIKLREMPAQASIVNQGDRPSHCCLVIEGFVCRSLTKPDGKRQILAVHIAGDIPDLQSLYLRVLDHDIWTASPAKVGFIAHASLIPIIRSRPTIAAALWRETLIDAAIFREWIVNVGRRDARGAMAHFLVEQGMRLSSVGIGNLEKFQLPLTQCELGDVLGLTPVHVNRVLQQLRKDNLLDFKKGIVEILDLGRLKEAAEFDALYLHRSPAL
jgi:CRP-like cAMP-binding protein